MINRKDKQYHLILLALFIIGLVTSGIHSYDFFTWCLEVSPGIIGVIILIAIYPRFKFSNLVYTLILFHTFIFMIGGHWTYARVPLFDWIRDTFHMGRNNYDKVGHFAQGFVPALIAREYFIRKKVINGKFWLAFITVLVILGFSAFYEFFEWWVSLLTGSAGDSFLGTQGYIWDTQSDMFLAFIGAGVALVFLSRLHDKSINKIKD
jgi:putative membrane protein